VPLILACIGLRCEWAKSRARADRWNEEVELVMEEMRRVLAFLEWKAAWWMKQGDTHLDVSPNIADGIRAYAAKQAHINRALGDSFRKRWNSTSKTSHRHQDQDDNGGSADDSEAAEGADENAERMSETDD
jgi:hypothetical protein